MTHKRKNKYDLNQLIFWQKIDLNPIDLNQPTLINGSS